MTRPTGYLVDLALRLAHRLFVRRLGFVLEHLLDGPDRRPRGAKHCTRLCRCRFGCLFRGSSRLLLGPDPTQPCGKRLDLVIASGEATRRLGFAFDRWLVYGKGGVAWAHDKYSTNFYTFPGTIGIDETRIGWTVGGGVEYAFAPNWSGKLEYNYMDFGSKNVSFAPFTSTAIDQQIHAVKFGINYKFGGGPLLARY